jgi:exosortase/archaeosortase family protein
VDGARDRLPPGALGARRPGQRPDGLVHDLLVRDHRPARWTRKLIGLGVGLPLLLAINQVRLVSLCYVQHWIPEYFETIHILIWQSLIVVLTVALWLVWAITLAETREVPSA